MRTKKRKKLLGIGIISVFFFVLISTFIVIQITSKENDTNIVLSNHYMTYNTENFRYLSDIPYDQAKTTVGWRNVYIDKNSDGDLISLNLEGKRTYFIKGIFAHATSDVIYDISTYNTYDLFTTYVGVDASRGNNGDGVRFNIYTSTDGITWTKKYAMERNIKGNDNAVFVSIDIQGVNYLKLEALQSGNNNSDHAVYANAKLIKSDYVEDTTEVDFIHPVSYYDEQLKNYSIDQIIADQELLLLQRTLVSRVGYDLLQAFARYSDENKAVLNWLMNDQETLKKYITGGKPIGNYIDSLKVLVELYEKYQGDFNPSVEHHEVYKTMFLALSLTHSSNVCLWISSTPCSNAVTRYQIYKDLYQAGLLQNQIFESLSVEEMRWVVGNLIDDEEIKWLNAHARKNPVFDKAGNKTSDYNLDPYHYITYRKGYDYAKDEYYDQSEYEKWNTKYDLSSYEITYRKGFPKLWIVMEQGAVCGGISKLGANLNQVFGVPAAGIGQPGHAAYLVYSKNADGKGMWSIYNNISGWTGSEKGERMLNDWGSNSSKWNSYYQVSYVLLAQSALNEYDKYEKAEIVLLLEEVYADDYEKLETVYEKALEIEPINLDAWYGLVKTYQWDHSKTDANYYTLATRITQNLKYYPLPMYDLFRLIKPSIQSTEYKIKIDALLDATLRADTKVTNAEYIQASATRDMANYLLGNNKFELATFSFDGEDAGKIVLAEQYQDANSVTQYQYCLDGLNNSDPNNITCTTAWVQTSDKKRTLTEEELNRISTENGISIQMVGVDTIYTIDIIKPEAPTNLYNNDLEDQVIGVTDKMEWQLENTNTWTKFSEKLPDLSGDKVVKVRIGKTGHYLASDSVSFAFNTDANNKTQKYVPIKRLSVAAVSSEETSQKNQAANALDGNIKTIWHTYWNGSDTEKYITIKVDTPIYLSKLQYVPRQDSTNGRIKNAQVLVSMDGNTWEEVVPSTSWPTNNQTKVITLEESVLAQYIKIVGTETAGSYASAAMINVFEDTTKEVKVTPTPTPSESPEPTPSESPIPTPEETPVPSPDENQEKTPSEDQESAPGESVTPIEPEATPTPAPEIVPTPLPESTPSVEATKEPVPTPSPTPTATSYIADAYRPTPTNTPAPQEESEEKESVQEQETEKTEEEKTVSKQNYEPKETPWLEENGTKLLVITLLSVVAFVVIIL